MAVARLAIVWMPAVMREDRETVWTQACDASGSRADVTGEELRVLSMVAAAEQTSSTSTIESHFIGEATAEADWVFSGGSVAGAESATRMLAASSQSSSSTGPMVRQPAQPELLDFVPRRR